MYEVKVVTYHPFLSVGYMRNMKNIDKMYIFRPFCTVLDEWHTYQCSKSSKNNALYAVSLSPSFHLIIRTA